MIPLALLLACDDPEATGPAPAEEYTDADDIPTPGDDVDDVEPDDTEDLAVGPVTYTFDDVESLVYVQVFKDEDAWGSDLAHDHVIRATDWSGTVVLDTDDAASCTLNFEIPVRSLSVDEEGMRELVGYDQELAEDDRAEIRDNMLSSDQLNVSVHDTISFTGSDCQLDGDVMTVDGALTVTGNTGRFSVALSWVISEERLYLQGGIDAVHSDFGMSPYSAYGGFVRNSDPLIFTIDVVGAPEG